MGTVTTRSPSREDFARRSQRRPSIIPGRHLARTKERRGGLSLSICSWYLFVPGAFSREGEASEELTVRTAARHRVGGRDRGCRLRGRGGGRREDRGQRVVPGGNDRGLQLPGDPSVPGGAASRDGAEQRGRLSCSEHLEAGRHPG